MDSERRHELERNDLKYWFTVTLPKLLQKYGNMLAIGLILVCVATILFNFRSRAAQQNEVIARENLAVGWNQLGNLRQLMTNPDVGASMVTERLNSAGNALTAFGAVLSADVEPASKAWALLGQGEVYWLLGSAPELAVTTTQPVVSLTTQSSEGYLTNAEVAYRQILTDYTNHDRAVAISLFSMAAIAEQRADFKGAADWYDRIEKLPSITPADLDAVKRRRELLAEIQKPLLIGAGVASASPTPTTPSPTTPASSTTPTSTTPTEAQPAPAPTPAPAAPATVPAPANAP